MALKKVPYPRLAPLVKDFLGPEDEPTKNLIRDLHEARLRGYLRRSELETICRWKSPRALQHIKNNSAAQVKSATRRALETRSEQTRLEALCGLKGVSVPMASAILMLLNPKRYGVIDIRVWQLLYAMGTVTKNPKGVGFTFSNWYQYLMVLRYFSKRFGVTAREVEKAIFAAHRDYQKGTLYTNGKTIPAKPWAGNRVPILPEA